MTLFSVDGEVAGGGASRVDGADLGERSVRMDLIGEDTAVFFNVFGAGVDYVESRDIIRK